MIRWRISLWNIGRDKVSIILFYRFINSITLLLAGSSYGNFYWGALLNWNENSNHYNGYTRFIFSEMPRPKVGCVTHDLRLMCTQ